MSSNNKENVNISHKKKTLKQKTVYKGKEKQYKNIIDDKSEERNGFQLKEKKMKKISKEKFIIFIVG